MIHSSTTSQSRSKATVTKAVAASTAPLEPRDSVSLAGGPSLSFEVDPRYLAIHTIVGRPNPSNENWKLVSDFQKRAYQRDDEAFQLLRRYDRPVESLQHEGELGLRAERLIADMSADPAFKLIQEQTEKAAEHLNQEWQRDLSTTYPIMKEMTGLDLSLKLKVLVTHPGQTNGKSFGKDKILWTDRSDFPHYNSVYLWHEALHKVIQPSAETNQVGNPSHALIELLADNELRVRLNGGTCPPFEGHPENEPFRQQMTPGFRAYLQQPEKDIHAYLKSAEAMFESK